LPFAFKRYNDCILLVNYAGEHYFIDSIEFEQLLGHTLDKDTSTFKTLKSKFFIYNDLEELHSVIELLANQIRTKQQYLLNFTSLHMIETTTLCNLRCTYCHASTASCDTDKYNRHNVFNKDAIDKIIEMIFQTASKYIKIELQGGEPLTHWGLCKYIIDKSYQKNLEHEDKSIEIILCTNLTLMDESKLEFLKKYKVIISTSLDGTQEMHDAHRVTYGNKGSYNTFVQKLFLTRKVLGHNSVGALLTVTSKNLYRLKEVIDEYIRLEFDGIFIRPLNPYGRAKDLDNIDFGYSIEEFINEYIKALNYIISLNLNGKVFVDYYSSLLMRRILTPFSTGFVDLQSPAGAGISGVMYDFDGNVYPTDEARMLARMGDNNFCIGNVIKNSYSEIFYSEKLVNITKSSILQTMPGCHHCVFNMYCGSDPIRNYAEYKDLTGFRPDSGFCKRNMLIFDYLLDIVKKNNVDAMNVFWSWINKKNVKEIAI
jgi:His-Xaa-Ser system radical SAM maturase HxsB